MNVQFVLSRLYALHPLAVSTTVEFLELRKVSNSFELESLLLTMCIDARGSFANSRSFGDFEECVGITLALIEE